MKNKYLSRLFIIIIISCTALFSACDGKVEIEQTTTLAKDNQAPEGSRIELTAEDYARAEQWMRPNIFKLVKNLTVTPHWIGDSASFWYRRETNEGIEFTRVDAQSGDKSPLFDHEAMAEALTRAGEKDIQAGKLPMSGFEFNADLSRITFKIRKMNYECDLVKPVCDSEPVVNISGGVLVAPDGASGIRTGEDGNLYLVNLTDQQEKPLTDDGEPHFGYGIYYGNWKAAVVPRNRNGGDANHPPMEAKWAQDSRHVLVTRLDERHVAEYHWLETVPGDGSFRPILYTSRVPLTGEREAILDWFVIDTETGRKVRLELPYEDLFQVHQDMLAIRKHWWSDDYSRLWVLTWGDTLKSAHLYEIDLATGRAREAVTETMHPRMDTNTTSYNPPNVWLVNEGEQVIWFSQRSGWGHLYLYDTATGEMINQITSGDWLMRDIIRVDEEDRSIYFTGTHKEGGNPYYKYLYRVNFDGTGLKLLTPEPADHMIESPYNDVLSLSDTDGSGVLSPDNRWIVYDYSRIDQPTKSVIRNAESGELIAEFEQADASALYAAGWQHPEPFVAKAEDGTTDLYGVIFKPRDFDANQSYPVIDSQYASPLTAVVPHDFPASLRGVPAAVRTASLTELGFVAVAVDARGTTFRNRAFSHHSWQNLNQIGLYDHIAVIRQLAEDRPWMDLDRIGIHGGSYGGFTAFRAMLEYPEFYKVGISNAGMGNLQTMYPDYHWEAFHGEAYYEDESLLRPTPVSRPVNYMNNDVTEQASRLEGDLLIMLGELDENVFPATTLALVAELVRLDKDFDMVYLPNRPHRFNSPWAVRRMWNHFVEHLHGTEPPDYRMTTSFD
jgi:dipeptidyl aminopeptidase/acylaminoacyl peptidase